MHLVSSLAVLSIAASLGAQQPDTRLAELARFETRVANPLPVRDRMRNRPDRLPTPAVGGTSELAFSADGKLLAADGGGGLSVARTTGEVIASFAGNHGFCATETGSEFWLAEPKRIYRWNAEQGLKLETYRFSGSPDMVVVSILGMESALPQQRGAAFRGHRQGRARCARRLRRALTGSRRTPVESLPRRWVPGSASVHPGLRGHGSR